MGAWRSSKQWLCVLAMSWPALTPAAQQAGAADTRPLVLAQARYDAARAVFEQRVATCMRDQQRAVDAAVFQGLGLSPRQQEVAAFVLSARAAHVCEEDAKGRLAVALGVYRSVASHHGVTLPPDAERYAALLFDRERSALEREATEYASLTPEQRSKLEALPELQRPFDFVGTLDQLRSRNR